MKCNRVLLAIGAGVTLSLVVALVATAATTLTVVSTDPFTNTTSFHATEVEPDTFANGSTIVSTFQSGRFQDGGASNIGFATSTDAGSTWQHGFLPGTTVFATPAGPYDRATDPAVAFDAKRGVWLINSLGLNVAPNGVIGTAVFVNSSANATTWNSPVSVAVAARGQNFDKNWIACDGTATSPHFGNCYVEWDDFGHLNQLHMAVSSDGGKTWTEGRVPRHSVVIGGQPLVQPNGRVVVPIDTGNESAVESFVSTDGGVSYTGPFSVANIISHTEAGSLRSGPLPTAEVDGAGTLFVAWEDCRFEPGCTANDIVVSKSGDGQSWTAPVRIPIDAVGSGVDHFLPGLAVDGTTSGSSAHLALTYYFYPNTNCTTSTCQLDVGFVSSTNGGSTWSSPVQLAGPMALTSLPDTSQGFMVGDYISTSFVTTTTRPSARVAQTVFAVGIPVAGKTCTLGEVTSCNEPMEAPSSAVAVTGGTQAAAADPVLSAASDHPAPMNIRHE
jgi:hypothetical protein